MFNFFEAIRKNSFYRNSLLAVLFAAFIPTLATALGSYFIGTSQVKSEINDRQKFQIRQSEEKIDEQFLLMEQTVVKWSFNSAFTNVINSNDIKRDPAFMNDLYNVLTLMKGSNQMIEDVFFYDSGEGIIINDKVGINYLDSAEKVKCESLFSQNDYFYYLENFKIEFFDESRSFNNNVFVCKASLWGQANKGVIVVSLNKSTINNMLQLLNPDISSRFFLISKDGKAYSGKNQNKPENDTINDLIVKDVFQSSEPSDIFFKRYISETYSIAYSTYSKNHWRFVTSVPLSRMMAPVTRTSTLLIIVSLSSLLLVIMISVLMSKKIYKPVGSLTKYLSKELGFTRDVKALNEDDFSFIRYNIDRLNDEQLQLHFYIDRNKATLMNSFLLQLVHGSFYYYSESELRQSLDVMDCSLKGESCCVLYLSLFISGENAAKFIQGDEQLATYATVNIMDDLALSTFGVIEILNLHNLAAAILLEPQSTTPEEQREEVLRICENLNAKISKYLGLNIVIGVSNPNYGLKGLPNAFKEAELCTHYRDTEKRTEILFAEDLFKTEEKLSSYPVDIENSIIQDIKMDLCKEACDKIPLFLQELKKNSAKEHYIRINMLNLLGSIVHTMMQTGVDINVLFRGATLYEQLINLNEPEEMARFMKDDVIGVYANDIKRFYEVKYRHIIDQVVDYIHNNYESDLSLDICATEVNISAKRLSVIFYRLNGIYFLDYVTNLRLHKAKELLKDTDGNINEIASQVGYQPQYFNKLFKKKVGYTPGEYRQSHR